MNLREAIRTGRPFKRPCHDFWMIAFQNWFFEYLPEPEDRSSQGKEFRPPRAVYIHPSAHLTDDWEIK